MRVFVWVASSMLSCVAVLAVRCRLAGLPWLTCEMSRRRRYEPTRRPSRSTAGTVPERYNIAQDVCDKHPPDKLAMVWEDYRGNERRVNWGELQELSNRFANVLARPRGGARRPGRGGAARRRRRPRPSSSAPGSSGRSCSRCRSSTATRASRTGYATPRPRCSSPTPTTPSRFDDAPVDDVLVLDARLVRRRGDPRSSASTPRPTTRRSSTTPSGTTGLAKGILHAHRYLLGARGVHLLPRRPGRRALPRHGRVGLGGRHRAAARARGAWARSSSSSSARAASTPTSSSRCSPSTG